MSYGHEFPFQAAGQRRQEALAYCQETIRRWELAMPDGEPLVLDIGLGKFGVI